MRRGDHQPSKNDAGRCRRCGLPAAYGGMCPPGYWMTETEADAWSKSSDSERARLERKLGAALIRGTDQKEGT